MNTQPLTLLPETRQSLTRLAPRIAFHGTRRLKQLLKKDSIYSDRSNGSAIMFTHCPDRAVKQAFGGPKRFGDGQPAILAVCWDGIVEELTPREFDAEAELNMGGPDEELWVHRPVRELYRFLIGALLLERVGGSSPLVVATPVDGIWQSFPQ